ncbi:MAG: PfkB family carbohydrate kinase, partial [Tepidisphaeraceae bacterium]
MSFSREQICELTARKLLAAAPGLSSIKSLVGLDGFVDEIIAVVDKRQDNDSYEPIHMIDQLGRKICNAAGQSSNYELVVKETRVGGNGPLMAGALASFGMNVTYIGALGYPNLHPIFAELATKANVVSVGEPAHTDALEFDDGKLMLGKLTPFNDVTWDNLLSRVGRNKLERLMTGARLIGMVNWTMLPHMSRIWARMLDEVIPNT